jgi:hypothetical protein
MNNKIIGFTIIPSARDNECHKQIDVFDSGLNSKFLTHQNFRIHLWGIGELDKCMINESVYSMSFPLHASLEDRNILMGLTPDGIDIENDWLGSIPVFYNKRTKVVSTLINHVVDKSHLEIDAEGMNCFLDFGYSVLERTPLKDVRFLRFYSKLVIHESGISIEYKPDLIHEDKYNYPETKVFDLIKEYIQTNEVRTYNEIIIPTSGGYDSRLLNYFVQDKKRIRSYTYGISPNQSDSYEVVYAKKLSEILNTEWRQVTLGKFNDTIPEWFEIFGCSTHLHGMYHIEFYREIKKNHLFNPTLLSGIIGDAWAGSIKEVEIKCPDDIDRLGYTHGLNSNSKHSKVWNEPGPWIDFYNQNLQYLNSHFYQIILCMRFKIILLSYLMTIPEYFGIACWTPFLNMKIALSMLSLPLERRKGRLWQVDFYKREGLYLEGMNLQCSKENNLNIQALQMTSLESLDVKMLSKFVYKDYVDSINSKLKTIG